MAVPDIIKKLDPSIYKTAMRAEQLQTVKPIIAYWCNVRVLGQIVAHQAKEKASNEAKAELLRKRNYENADDEDVQMVRVWTADVDIQTYGEMIMDKLEAFKESHKEEEAVVDAEISQLYVEQFAQETLDRAQRVVDANKVTATTANTFDAAATFFGLINNWGTPSKETLQKIKYAKWNAQRILKALQKGLDPNESNPKPEELPEDTHMSSDHGNAQDGNNAPGRGLPGAPAEADTPGDAGSLWPAEQYTRRDSAGVSLPHSPASSAGNTGGATNNMTAGVQDAHHLPSVPSHMADVPSFVDPVSPTLPSLTPGTAPAGMFDSPPEPVPSLPPAPSGPSLGPSAYPGYGAPTPQIYTPPAGRAVPATYSQPPQPPQPPPPKPKVDDAAIAAAQKHAKWAISALNFEDVATATRELRRALQQLGDLQVELPE